MKPAIMELGSRSGNHVRRYRSSVERQYVRRCQVAIDHFVASSTETPFGGVKDSGFGGEGGAEGLQCYTVVKNVASDGLISAPVRCGCFAPSWTHSAVKSMPGMERRLGRIIPLHDWQPHGP
jgi:hypothetical protein